MSIVILFLTTLPLTNNAWVFCQTFLQTSGLKRHITYVTQMEQQIKIIWLVNFQEHSNNNNKSPKTKFCNTFVLFPITHRCSFSEFLSLKV